ncbi:AAA family ATPase [Patescibacteria group bacterium]|nr:AAA family ATPase [Patescibacteria group bacterium]MBU4600998.1 AAA family ATPase [Patescibacteria group bacterium]MCG2698031.1 AAA family ATPase [Candidatus Parcubacteria bacterium]
MYLEKLEIQGFKSFANKNTLVFPGMLGKDKRGITAIVGPNGSGKSNVADAVRWALGEQSMKTLRGKKSEDIIFSGSDKKGKLGMAEVSLYLNNENGAVDLGKEYKSEPANYSQIVLTRRLYREGNSEYLINNSRARLSDIQIMLAKAKFGQKTYSVIGQGMVEGFLNTSLAERKEFFDEATGVKQFQIKRDDSLNKLRSSYDNLNQASMLLSEIEPRLKSLTRQVSKLQKRGEIETELKALQLDYYSKIWRELNGKFNEYNKNFLEIEKIKTEKEKKIESLNKELDKMEAREKENHEFDEWQKELSEAQGKKDAIIKQIARLEAQFELKLEASGQFDISWLANKKEELAGDLAMKQEEINKLNINIKPEREKLADLEKEAIGINSKIYALNDDLEKFDLAGEVELEEILQCLRKALENLKKAEDEQDANIARPFLAEAKKMLEKALIDSKQINSKSRMDSIKNDLINLAGLKEKTITKISESKLRVSAWHERAKLLGSETIRMEEEIKSIDGKLKPREKQFGSAEGEKETKELKNKLTAADGEINGLKEKINSYASEEDKKKNRLFILQRDIQSMQSEANRLSGRLSEIKISSTRHETNLENLEIEIRNNLGGLKGVKEHKSNADIDPEQVRGQIGQLKRQLDLIGGIDPEIEKEYAETKERFDFLDGQVSDLTKAIGSLEEIIKELDIMIKERFDHEFKLISAKFEEYFKILFNGGRAKIIKVMEDKAADNRQQTADRLDEDSPVLLDSQQGKNSDVKKIKFLQKHNATGMAGVEIQATPPGKKIKSVSMLSGGERALAAIALICAIISANPSPFVVLDEVDAALDESNSERLAKILDDLSHKTQFIVVTHNRASMRRASILYGITMGDDGVSKLLSIKLDEMGK